MKYFLDAVESKMIVVDESGSVRVLEEVGAVAGGGTPSKKTKKYKKPDDDDEPLERTGKRTRLTPEVLNRIKELLNTGMSVKEIEEETGVSNPTIYKIKNTIE